MDVHTICFIGGTMLYSVCWLSIYFEIFVSSFFSSSRYLSRSYG